MRGNFSRIPSTEKSTLLRTMAKAMVCIYANETSLLPSITYLLTANIKVHIDHSYYLYRFDTCDEQEVGRVPRKILENEFFQLKY